MRRHASAIAVLLSALALAVALTGRPVLPTAGAAVDAGTDAVSSPRIAVVASIRVMNDLMASERFKPARDEMHESLENEMEPIIEQGKSLEARLKDIDDDSDEAKQIKQRLMGLQGALAKKQQEVGIRMEKFVSDQSLEAYKLVRDSAVAIAQDHGFTYVVASQSADDEILSGPVAVLMNEILSRPLIMSPGSADITEEVRADLKLE